MVSGYGCCNNEKDPLHCVLSHGTVGVQGNVGKVEDCPVYVDGTLGHNDNKHCRYRDKVQVFRFDQFTTTSVEQSKKKKKEEEGNENACCKTISLKEWMDQVKGEIEADEDDEDDETNESQEEEHDDDNTFLSRRERVLADLHDRFIPIVREILACHQLYASAWHTAYDDENDDIVIRKFARPNYRQANDQYANYLHNDAWISADDDDDTTKIAMVNIWFVLNERPPRNTLVFWETDATRTRQSHMLHAAPCRNDETTTTLTVVHDATLAWGRFYVFVAGQRNTVDRVLLHGAMNVGASPSSAVAAEPESGSTDTTTNVHNEDEVRRSVEMRYTLHIPKVTTKQT